MRLREQQAALRDATALGPPGPPLARRFTLARRTLIRARLDAWLDGELDRALSDRELMTKVFQEASKQDQEPGRSAAAPERHWPEVEATGWISDGGTRHLSSNAGGAREVHLNQEVLRQPTTTESTPMESTLALTLLALAVAPAASAFGFGAKKEQLVCEVSGTPAGSGKPSGGSLISKLDDAGRASVSTKVNVLKNGSPYLNGVKVLLVVTTDSNKKRWLSGKYTDASGKVLYTSKAFIRMDVWSSIQWEPANLWR